MKHILKQFLCWFLFISALCTLSPAKAHAAEALWPDSPEIGSEGAILIEASTGIVLYEKNGFEAFYPASTTKLMTTLLAIEQCPLTDIITCSYDSVHKIGWDSSRIGLVEGEQLTMEEALYAILLASANEVSYAVAEHIGGTLTEFAELMNARAEELGCVNTNFKNPHGLHDPEHYSCPYDLAQIARKLIEYPTFARISGSYYHEIPATNLNVSRVIANTHQILRKKITYEGVFAGKTGHTSNAGNCLVTCAERDGMTLICVIMKAPDSTVVYDDTIALLDYGFQNFSLTPFTSAESSSSNAFPALFDDGEALISEVSDLLSMEGTFLVLPKNTSIDDLNKKISFEAKDVLCSGKNSIGKVEYYCEDHYVGSAEILYYSENNVIVVPSPTASPSPSATPVPTESPDSESSPEASAVPTAPPSSPVSGEDSSESDFRPLIIGGIVGVCVLVIGLYLVLIELPYRKRKREYYRRRSRR